jgi:AcrR family transcriptional regulator
MARPLSEGVKTQNGSGAAGPDPQVEVDEPREAKRLSILKAAARIFNERGFHQTSVADVADALGVSKPFLYYYLKNKDDILFECSRIATEQLHAVLDEARTARLSGWERLRGLLRGYAQVMTTDFGICLIRNTAPGFLPPQARRKLWAGRRRLNSEVERIIAQGIADGSIRSCDPKMVSFALFGAFNWISFWYQDKGPLNADTIADYYIDLFARGIARGEESSK